MFARDIPQCCIERADDTHEDVIGMLECQAEIQLAEQIFAIECIFTFQVGV